MLSNALLPYRPKAVGRCRRCCQCGYVWCAFVSEPSPLSLFYSSNFPWNYWTAMHCQWFVLMAVSIFRPTDLCLLKYCRLEKNIQILLITIVTRHFLIFTYLIWAQSRNNMINIKIILITFYHWQQNKKIIILLKTGSKNYQTYSLSLSNERLQSLFGGNSCYNFLPGRVHQLYLIWKVVEISLTVNQNDSSSVRFA